MPDLDLLEPALDRALRHTNFFNGRVLTARDLQDEQAADHAHRRYLGQAIGEGVVYGLDVTRDPTTTRSVVHVSAGLALNREGGVLSLADDASVHLVPTPDARDREGGLFVVCTSQPPSATLSDIGAYLLVLGPATGFEERVPLVGLADGGVAGGCGDRFLVEGVQFRLVRLTLDPDDESRTARLLRTLAGAGTLSVRDQSRLRNLLAHYAFGTEALQAFPRDPRDVARTYGALDGLRALGGVLTDCEVPLALLHWTDDGLQFVDEWAVRRRPAAPSPSARWPLHVSPRRLAEAEAVFLQFQDHLDALDGVPRVDARTHFHFLPPAGYVPTERDTFFDQIPTTDAVLDEAAARAVVHDSFYLDPIDLTDPPPILRYRIPASPYVLYARQVRVRLADVGDPTFPRPETAPGRVTIRARMSEREGADRDEPLRGETASQDPLATLLLQHLVAKGRKPPFREKDVLDAVGRLFTATARHEATGVTYPAPPELPAKAGRTPGSLPVPKDTEVGLGELRFRTSGELPPGRYRVTLESPFGTQDTLRTLNEGEHLTVAFRLVAPGREEQPGASERPKRPSPTIPADWVEPRWYGEAHLPPQIAERHTEWPWVEAEREGFRPQPDPLPPDIEEAFVRWGNELRRLHPGAPIDPGDIRVYLDEGYTPDSTPPQAPYAYVVFGEGGAAVPLLLTPTHRTLGRSVPLGQSDVLGADRETERRLRDLGIDRLDVLAAGWGGLVQEAAAVPLGVAGELLSTARAEVETLHDGLGLFGGIDGGLRASLDAAGVRNAVDLANANPERLVDALGQQERTLSPARARLLIEEARSTVDPAFWSLGAAETGLSPTDVETLTQGGIVTLGDFRHRAESDEGQAELESLLGASAQAIATAAGRASEAVGGAVETVQLRRAERAPVSSVADVGSQPALALGSLGVATQGDLAAADVERVVGAFGGDAGAAQAAINAARSRLGLQP